MQVRCPWHIALGAGIPWLGWILESRGLPLLALILCGGLIALFCVYEYLQFKYRTNHPELELLFGGFYHDDSYLDIYEAAVAFGISTAVLVILLGMGLSLPTVTTQ